MLSAFSIHATLLVKLFGDSVAHFQTKKRRLSVHSDNRPMARQEW